MKKILIILLVLSPYLFAPTCDVTCIIGAIKNAQNAFEGGIEVKGQVRGSEGVFTQGKALVQVQILRNNDVEARMMVYRKDGDSFKMKPRTLTVPYGEKRHKLKMNNGKYCVIKVNNFKTDEEIIRRMHMDQLLDAMRNVVIE